MRKVLIISAILVLAFSSMTFATETRLESLGLQNQAWMTQDLASIQLFPAQLANYGNLVDIEIANTGGQGTAGGGVTFNLGGNVLGLADIPYTGNLNALRTLVAGTNLLSLVANPIHQTLVGYGMNMGGMTGGLGLSYGSQAVNNQVGPITGNSSKTITDNSLQNIGIFLGLGISSDSPIDIGVTIGLPGASYSNKATNNAGQFYGAGSNNSESAGGVELGINGRLGLGSLLADIAIDFTSLQDTLDIKDYPGAGGGNPTASTEQITQLSGMGLGLGAAQTVKPSDNTDVIIGGVLNFVTYSDSNQTTDKITGAKGNKVTDSGSVFKIPVYLAAEAKLNSTFTLRGGLARPLYAVGSDETKTTNNTGTIADATNSDVGNNNSGLVGQLTASDTPITAVGVGVKIGDVVFDVDASDALLFNGPFFFTGTASALAYQVALTYSWK